MTCHFTEKMKIWYSLKNILFKKKLEWSARTRSGK